MSSDESVASQAPPFVMFVDDVFVAAGRGTVVTGQVDRGVIRPGDTVEILGPDDTIRTTVASLDRFGHRPVEASVGDNVALVLRDVPDGAIKPGHIVVTT